MAASDPRQSWRAGDGLLIVGHGTRNPDGVAEALRLTDRVAEQLPEVPVRMGFLELAEPNIANSFADLVQAGARRITVSPLLLLAAGHAKQDIPDALQACAAEHPGIELRVATHLGCHEKLLALSRKRFDEAWSAHFGQAGQTGEDHDARLRDTLLLMVGRGSRDPGANSQMAQFARLRWEQQPLGWQEVCFTAMTRPSLDEGLRMAARLPFTQVVVQPHLLFQGDLLSRIRRNVEEFASQEASGELGESGAIPSTKRPGRRWVVTNQLGPDELLALALVENACTASQFRPQ